MGWYKITYKEEGIKMDIVEVLNRPEYQFIQTNPHLGGGDAICNIWW